MKITIESIAIEQKSVFVQMMELYNYDFSEFSNDDLNEYGYFGYSRIDDYWNEEGRYPFFIRVDGKLAGLVLVRSCSEYMDLQRPHQIAEFFIMKKYRKKGVGSIVAKEIFGRFAGGWEISVWSNNPVAKKFWESVVHEYTNGKYISFSSPENQIEGFAFYNMSIPDTSSVMQQELLSKKNQNQKRKEPER